MSTTTRLFGLLSRGGVISCSTRQRGFAEMFEYAAHVVGNDPHNETIEQRHISVRSRSGNNAPSRQETEIRHTGREFFGPFGPHLGVFGIS